MQARGGTPQVAAKFHQFDVEKRKNRIGQYLIRAGCFRLEQA
jgi:hypothetical protein